MKDFCEHKRRAVSILNVGGVDHRVNQIALSVGEDVAFAALDLLPRVIAAWATAVRGFHALAIDHTGAGRPLATLCLAEIISSA